MKPLDDRQRDGYGTSQAVLNKTSESEHAPR
jgi:hypothetical protein